MSIRVINDAVLVEDNTASKEVELGGIIIPNFDMNKLRICNIVGVGNKVKYYRVGMRAILSKGCGDNIEMDGKKYLIVKEHEIIGEHK
jgi:co-chaperonin GroES (HSP10)